MRHRALGASGSRPSPGPAAIAFAALAGFAAIPAAATPLEFLTVGDPIEAELRILDLLDPAPLGSRILLPHLHTRPLHRFELQGTGAIGDWPATHAVSLARVERVLARDASAGFDPRPGYAGTPRLLEADGGDGARFEVSAGVEGRGDVDEHVSEYASGSGMHVRAGGAFERWLAFSHLIVGHVANARTFADPLVPESDFIVHTEESYVAYGAPLWGAQLGRNRFHWGPGEEASLTLSRTSPPITALAMRARMEALRLDAIALSATLATAGGEQLAAHRLEWQAMSSLRLGVTEMARYQASSWEPLYLVGVIPYILVQRLEVQDEPDSTHRNNVIASFDAAWRIAPGARVYGELLIDDLNMRTTDVPDKLAFQLGLEGANLLGGSRVSWGAEFTRLSRFVYTSFFGRSFEAQGQPLGYFTGPDSRRIKLRGAWDPSADWQVRVAAALTDQGEGGLDQPFIPGSPPPDAFDFLGVVERTREFEVGARWWPAGGVDVALAAGWRWIENQHHVSGADDATPFGSLAVRLTR